MGARSASELTAAQLDDLAAGSRAKAWAETEATIHGWRRQQALPSARPCPWFHVAGRPGMKSAAPRRNWLSALQCLVGAAVDRSCLLGWEALAWTFPAQAMTRQVAHRGLASGGLPGFWRRPCPLPFPLRIGSFFLRPRPFPPYPSSRS